MKHKMTSLDHRSRNERDIAILLPLAAATTARLLQLDPTGENALAYRRVFEEAQERRDAEDAGERLP